VASLLQHAHLPAGASTLGPVPVPHPGPTASDGAHTPEEPPVRTVVRAPAEHRSALARALHDAAAVRSARKEPGAVRVQVDPLDVV
jgi:primosomal protein N' (replication factor Y) (superfamily II helicase)